MLTSRSLADPQTAHRRGYARLTTSPSEFRPTDRVPDGPPRTAVGIGSGSVSATKGIAGLQRQ